MNGRLPILFFILSLSFYRYLAQDTLFALHPFIGPLIDRYEKYDYYLFPEIDSKRFKYGYIKVVNNGYLFYAHFDAGAVSVSTVDTAKILEYRSNISILRDYYTNKTPIDSTRKPHLSQIHVDTSAFKYYTLNPGILQEVERSLKSITSYPKVYARVKYEEESPRLTKQHFVRTFPSVLLWPGYRKKK